MQGLIEGFSVSLTLENLLFVVLGVTVGTIVGVLPGLGAAAGIAILMPLTYTLDPATAIIFLGGIYYGAMFGGRVPAILLNVPGDPSSVVTTFDGYPLRKQGKAGKALGMTAIASFLGGTVSLLALTFLAPMISRWAVKISSPEMFLITLIGLSMIAIISTNGVILGLLSASIGIVLATVGMDAISGNPRFTFGNINLLDGISVIPLAVGFFGVSELILLAEKRFKSEKADGKFPGLLPKLGELIGLRWSIIRGSLIGFFVGVIPGGSGTLASIVSYGAEKRVSKHPEKFGKGAMEGLTATETSDNAAATGSFIPFLTLGIPSNPVMALLAGALIVQGVTPGPQLIEDSPDIFWGVITSMYVGSIVVLILNLPLVRVFVQILRVPMGVMAAIILAVSVTGAYSVRNNVFDVILMLVFGVVGYLFKKTNLPVGPMILGFILAPIMESEFRRALLLSDGSLSIFIERPFSLALLIVMAAVFVFALIPKRKKLNRVPETAGYVEEPISSETTPHDVETSSTVLSSQSNSRYPDDAEQSQRKLE